MRSLVAGLARPLAIIFQQQFFYHFQIPDVWRLASVTPIFKKGEKD